MSTSRHRPTYLRTSQFSQIVVAQRNLFANQSIPPSPDLFLVSPPSSSKLFIAAPAVASAVAVVVEERDEKGEDEEQSGDEAEPAQLVTNYLITFEPPMHPVPIFKFGILTKLIYLDILFYLLSELFDIVMCFEL